MPYVIRLNTHGLELRFNPRSQRLEEIQVFDIKKISLTYGIEHPVTLSSHAYQPTLNNIHEYVGPTEPGVFSEDGSEYVITYNDAVSAISFLYYGINEFRGFNLPLRYRTMFKVMKKEVSLKKVITSN